MPTNETILLQVDVAYNEKRLGELRNDLANNKEQLKQLNAAFQAGTIPLKEYTAGQVRLAADARTLQQEQRVLIKATEQQKVANSAAAGSIDQLRAQLAAATRAYNALGEEERDNTEAGQKLQAQTKAISDQLKVLESAVGDTRRNVGNYAQSIGPLIQELVKLQEQQKTVGEGTAEYKKITKEIGFVTKATQEAGAKAGLSYEQTQAKLKGYGDAIRPVIQEVVKLEKEQENLDESSEAYTQIGFKVAALGKKLEKVPVEAKSVGTALKEAAGSSDVLSSATARYSSVQEKFTAVTNIAKAAIGGEITLLGALKLALIATGLGALVVILGSVFTYLTKTREGTQFLTNTMDQLGAVVNVVVDRLGAVGKAIVQLFKGDFSGAASTARAAMRGIGDEIDREVKLAGELSKARQQLERDTIRNIDTNKKLLNEVERLKNIRDNERNSIEKRTQANEAAFAIEFKREATLADLAKRKIALLQAEANQRGGLDKLSDEEFKNFKEAQNELADIQEDAAGKQNELITNRFQLQKELQERELANTKGHYNALALEAAEGSEQELNARIKAIEATAKAEAKTLNLTAGQRREIEQKALDDVQKLRDEYTAKRLEKAKQEVDQELQAATIQLQNENKAFDLRLRDLNAFIDKRQENLEHDFAQGLISQEEYEKSSIAIEKARLDGQIAAANEFKREKAGIEKAMNDNTLREERRLLSEKQRQAQRQRDLEDMRMSSAQATADSIISALGQESAAGQAAVIAKKTLAIIEIGINLQRQLSAIAVGTAGQVATDPTPVGLAAAFAYDATATILALAQAAAATVAVLAFRQGGQIDGPGTGTSDSVPAAGPLPGVQYRLSNGEHVLTAEEVRNMGGHGAVLQLREQYRQAGAVPVMQWLHGSTVASPQTHYAVGGAVGLPQVFDGGFAQRAISETGPVIDYDQMAAALARVIPTELGFKGARDAVSYAKKDAAMKQRFTLKSSKA